MRSDIQNTIKRNSKNIMVIKEVKELDPEYYTSQAVEKKNSNLFSKAKTRESKDLEEANDCKKTITKKEKKKLAFLEFDVPKEEY